MFAARWLSRDVDGFFKEYKGFLGVGKWVGEGYMPNEGTVFIAAQKLDPIALIEFKNGDISAEEFAEVLLVALDLLSGPSQPIGNEEFPRKIRLRSRLKDPQKRSDTSGDKDIKPPGVKIEYLTPCVQK